MLTAQSRQKNYADKRRKPLEFNVGDHVFLKVTTITVVGKSIKLRKLSSRYLGPFQILERYGTTAYKLALPPNLANIHVFHMSQLKKYLPDPSHAIKPENVHLQDKMTYELKPIG